MAKAKAKAAAGPSASTLSELAKALRQKKDEEADAADGPKAEAAAEEKEEVKPEPTVARRRLRGKSTDVEHPPKRSKKAVDLKTTLKRGKSSMEITVDDLLDADNFNPSELPFQLSWSNFEKLKKFYSLKDEETTTILLAMVGPSEEGKSYWSKFKVPLEMFDSKGVFMVSQPKAADTKGKNAANTEALQAVRSAHPEDLDMAIEDDDEDFEDACEGEGEEEEEVEQDDYDEPPPMKVPVDPKLNTPAAPKPEDVPKVPAWWAVFVLLPELGFRLIGIDFLQVIDPLSFFAM